MCVQFMYVCCVFELDGGGIYVYLGLGGSVCLICVF